ncbi:NAD-dependent epimerase/dehydratase family protein [Poseidonocella sedimentorum]|uniref:Nucleoside-diphosphate-sugar epimerase n=1 Tax=Poseidonocella sedimentorum TaxID=871652 RepID=A0A1I6DSM2_9RHOB|nr:NAD(P)-dependent oxidoreductase [Poseidonocella sedimentorum]SFR08490.1 Nucleoside-diphosphate-sugar epimerase [Poseidonocella sedimentorum]
MRLAITGGTGLVGREIVAAARAAGHEVRLLSRPGYRLGDRPVLGGIEALVHCAFDHLPGRYRGGEGEDPEGFVRRNLDGSRALFEAALAGGVGQVVFLSSRAVYRDLPGGGWLGEDTLPDPDSLYGEVKWACERALVEMDAPGFRAASLRATGVYGPGPGHKWSALFAAFRDGQTPPPRRGTEILGADLAAAVLLLIRRGARGAFNASDLVVDRHDLLAEVARRLSLSTPLPPPSDAPLSRMRCDRLRALGWRPSGAAGLSRALDQMLADLPPGAQASVGGSPSSRNP